MKKQLFFTVLFLLSFFAEAQFVTATQLRLRNNTDSVSSAATGNGTIRYDLASNKFRFRQNGSWVSLNTNSANDFWKITGTNTFTGNITNTGAFDVRFSNTSVTFDDDVIRINNPANTFAYTIVAAAIGNTRTLTLPLLTSNRTILAGSGMSSGRIPISASNGEMNFDGDLTYVSDILATPTLHLSGTSTSAGSVRFLEDTDDGTNYTDIKAGAQSANATYTLPTSVPASNGQVLSSTTGGTMSWVTKVDGSTGSSDNVLLRSDGTGGTTLQSSLITSDDVGVNSFAGSSTQSAELRIYEDTDDGTNFSAFKLGTQSADITYTLPTSAPAASGYVLQSLTNGTMSWVPRAALITPTDEEFMRSNGTADNLIGSGLFNRASSSLTFGSTSTGGSTRTMFTDGALSNISLFVDTKGTGKLIFDYPSIPEGSNKAMGASTLVGGTVTVSNTLVTANSRIYLTSQADGGTPGFVRISARSVGTSFTITSSSGTDTSTIAWLIIEP